MPTSEYMASLAKQYETLNKLIEEAENSQSRGESIKLYYKAQQKTANITENLEETLYEETSKGKRDAAQLTVECTDFFRLLALSGLLATGILFRKS